VVSCGSRTSCCGRSPTPRCAPHRCCGRTSASRISTKPSARTRRESGALDVSRSTLDLERRTVTALVYAVVVVAAIVAPSPTFAILVGVLAALGYLELRALFRHRTYQPWLVGILFVFAFIVVHTYSTSPG